MAYVRMHPKSPKFRMKVGTMPDFSGSKLVNQEIPKGLMDGLNRTFSLNQAPLKNSEVVFKDGMKMKRASSALFVDGDYVIDYVTGAITFSTKQVPQGKSIIIVDYKYL